MWCANGEGPGRNGRHEHRQAAGKCYGQRCHRQRSGAAGRAAYSVRHDHGHVVGAFGQRGTADVGGGIRTNIRTVQLPLVDQGRRSRGLHCECCATTIQYALARRRQRLNGRGERSGIHGQLHRWAGRSRLGAVAHRHSVVARIGHLGRTDRVEGVVPAHGRGPLEPLIAQGPCPRSVDREGHGITHRHRLRERRSDNGRGDRRGSHGQDGRIADHASRSVRNGHCHNITADASGRISLEGAEALAHVYIVQVPLATERR